MTSKHPALPTPLIAALLFTCCLFGWSCDKTDDTGTIEPENNLVLVLGQQDNLSTFADALHRTGRSSDLENRNLNFTIFAPNNAAFATYLQAAGYGSLSEVPAEALNGLVSYHLSFGKTVASSLDSARLINTFDNKRIFVYTTGTAGSIILNDQAQIVENNLMANNGVIHVLDAVLTPPTQSLATYIASRAEDEAPDFSLLYAALQRAGLVQLLTTDKSAYTLFAPTDAAFSAAGYATAEAIEAEEPAVLKDLLQYHLLPRYRFTSMFPNGQVSSQQGKKVTLNVDNRTITGAANSQPANLLTSEQDILTTNGILHAIDAVLLPGE